VVPAADLESLFGGCAGDLLDPAGRPDIELGTDLAEAGRCGEQGLESAPRWHMIARPAKARDKRRRQERPPNWRATDAAM